MRISSPSRLGPQHVYQCILWAWRRYEEAVEKQWKDEIEENRSDGTAESWQLFQKLKLQVFETMQKSTTDWLFQKGSVTLVYNGYVAELPIETKSLFYSYGKANYVKSWQPDWHPESKWQIWNMFFFRCTRKGKMTPNMDCILLLASYLWSACL